MPASQTPPATQINPKLIVPFVTSVRSVFATMVRVPTTVQRPYLKTDRAGLHEISSIIGFSGEVLGWAVLSLNREVAQKVVDSFAGTVIDLEGPDFPDAIGELSNMIAGGAKKELARRST